MHTRSVPIRGIAIGIALLASCSSSGATTVDTAGAPGSIVAGTVGGSDALAGGYRSAGIELGLTNGRTAPVTSPLDDGVYFALGWGSDGSTVTFTLGQWFACDDSDGVPDVPEVECAGGVGQLTEPSAQLAMASEATVVVATGHIDNQTFSGVSAAEYARLANGLSPAADAPTGYQFVAHNTFVRVEGGIIVAVEQHYSS